MGIDEKLFEEAREKIIGKDRERHGIGTLSEKTIHAVLKNYYAPDEDMHEIPIEGYVADIYTGTEISSDDNIAEIYSNFKGNWEIYKFLSIMPNIM